MSGRFIGRIRRPVCAAILPLFLCLYAAAGVETLPDTPPAATPTAPLTLGMCRDIALGNQPAIAAAQASVAAAVDRAKALDNLHGVASLARDLPIRRKQSALGIVIARGGLAQTEAETLYGVTFSYLSAVYANQQMDLAVQIRGNLNDLHKLVNEPFVKPESTDQKALNHSQLLLKDEHHNAVNSYVATLEGRLEEAEKGERRALAALREAMGVGCDYPLAALPRMLPCPKVETNKESFIALALERRGEMVQAVNAVQVVCLEVEAQGLSCRSLSRTFASGSDIHARPVPVGNYDGRSYRPSAVALEMPTSLVGSRNDRQTQARDYLHRAEAIAAKTRNLIALSVDDAYLRWAEKSSEAAKLEKAYKEHSQFSRKLLEETKRSISNEKNRLPLSPYPNMDDLMHANLLTTRLLLEWKEAHYQALLALVALEQATGGGFVVDFDAAPPCPPIDPPIQRDKPVP